MFIINYFRSFLRTASKDMKSDFSTTSFAPHERENMRKRLIKLDEHMRASSSAVPDFPKEHSWFNTAPLSFDRELKNKIVLIDFWTNCCINCIHVLKELEHLEHRFEKEPGVAFVGCHSAKFDNEKDSDIVRRAVLRYDVKHPVFNDNRMIFWSSMDVSCWPTIMVIGPHRYPIGLFTGEGNARPLELLIDVAIEHYKKDLSTDPLPIHLEEQKELERSKQLQESGAVEELRALKQNLSFPGKLIVVTKQ